MGPQGRLGLGLFLVLGMMKSVTVASVIDGNAQRRLLQSNPSVNASAVHPRIEINELDKRPASDRYRGLLILAWRRIQDTDPSDPESNYQLSGIHGAPYTAYNGSNGYGRSTGYCWHSSVLFPTWHRPHTLLFERILIKRAVEVANSFRNTTERARYASIAPTIRLPYWDWANPYNDNGDFPQLFITPTVEVVDPAANGTSMMTIANPLYQFVVPAPVESGFSWPASIAPGQATVRDPANTGSYTSDEQGFVASVQSSAGTLAYQVFSLLGAGSWDCLYNANCGLGVVDLESIHNTLHGAVGGTMSTVPASGFDPIFWMHHAQIDRIFWLWQQRWPDVWLPPTYESAGNFYTPGGQTFDASTELAPFWRDANGYFTSNDCRYINRLGYTYKAPAGGDPNPSNPPPPMPTRVQTQFQPQQQGGGGFGGLFDFFGRRRLQDASSSSASSNGASKQPTPAQQWKEAMRVYSKGYSSYRWQVNFAGVDKQQLGQPFYVHLFVAKLYDSSSLRDGAFKHRGYCGNYYQLSATNKATHTLGRSRIDITIDVTSCLRKAGVKVSFPPQVTGKPASGPAGSPASIKDFVWVATTRDGTDVSKRFDFGSPKLTWSVMLDGGLHVGSA